MAGIRLLKLSNFGLDYDCRVAGLKQVIELGI
jgi:hypothetical protein